MKKANAGNGRDLVAPRILVLLFLGLLVAVRGEGQTPFTDTGATLVGVSSSAVAWGDYDNDGDLDILLTGWDGAGRTARVYRNDGSGNFTDVGAPLTGMSDGSATWTDYDNDGDLDILLTGYSGPPVASPPPATKLYRNDAGTFVEVASTGLPPVAYSSAAWGDYDNDGDPDVLLTGWKGGPYLAGVYRNNGNGTFTDIGAGLPPVYEGSAAWGDYDNDGDLDILFTGRDSVSAYGAIFRNNGNGSFVAVVGVHASYNSSAAWGDYDNDGDLDVLLTGRDANNLLLTWVFRNDGGSFPGNGFAGVENGSVAWGDYDNDGDLDILSTGAQQYSLDTRVHRNDSGTFTDISAGLVGVGDSSAAWGDYDNDGDLDVLVAGYNYGVPATRLYRNNAATTNSAPATPSSLLAFVTSGQVTFNWTAATDSQTPAAGLTYNLRVGTTPGGSQVSSAMAAGSGYRRLPAMGNVQLGTSAVLKNLPSGTYYWSVQAIDSAYLGSPFASEGTFSTGTTSGCTYSVSPTAQNVAASGGQGAVSVVPSAPTCAWAAASGAPWITITSAASGTGSGTVLFSASANSGAARTGTLAVAGQTVTVSQPGPPLPPWHPFFAVDTLETPMVGDFNGDGKTDIITFTRQNPLAVGDVYVALSSGTQFVDKAGRVGSSDKWHDWFAITTDETVVIGDYDGDGKDDIATWLGKTTRQAYVALSTGAGMTPESVWVSSLGFDPSDVILAGDVNGDGKQDLVCFARRLGQVYVALSTGTAFRTPIPWHNFFAVSTYERPRVADVDGDGRADIVTFATDSPTAQGDVYVAMSDGTSFVDANGLANSSTKWHDWFAVQPKEQVRIGDLSGDGKDDFFTFLPPPFAQCYTVQSLGTAMGPNVLWREAVAPLSTDIPYVGDFNGDGKADILWFAQGEGKVYVSLGG